MKSKATSAEEEHKVSLQMVNDFFLKEMDGHIGSQQKLISGAEAKAAAAADALTMELTALKWTVDSEQTALRALQEHTRQDMTRLQSSIESAQDGVATLDKRLTKEVSEAQDMLKEVSTNIRSVSVQMATSTVNLANEVQSELEARTEQAAVEISGLKGRMESDVEEKAASHVSAVASSMEAKLSEYELELSQLRTGLAVEEAQRHQSEHSTMSCLLPRMPGTMVPTVEAGTAS